MTEGDGATAPARTMRWPFVAAILAGSFLLFLVQPMVARMALPRLGGAPAVWNSAMLVYQALLLGGYAYAHWLGRVPVRMQAARLGGWHAARIVYVPSAAEMAKQATVSDWIALSKDPETLDRLTMDSAQWQPLDRYPGFTPWTDDFASILPLLRAFNPELKND